MSTTVPPIRTARRGVRLTQWVGGHREAPWLFLLPGVLLYVVVIIGPTLASVFYSFTDYSGLGSANWIGLENYSRTLHDAQASASLKNTLLLTIVTVVIQNALGLLLALALHNPFRGRGLLRIVFFAPTVFSPLVIGYLWQYVFAPDGGLNRVLENVGLSGLTHVWLGETSTALWAIAAVIVWQYVGYSMIIFAAGLEGVPQELLEASSLDGASSWARFRDITLPLLAPAMTINLVLSLINGLRIFDQVAAMTGGGPGYATDTVSTVIYDKFSTGGFAYSTALAVELTVVTIVLSIIQVLVLRRREKVT